MTQKENIRKHADNVKNRKNGDNANTSGNKSWHLMPLIHSLGYDMFDDKEVRTLQEHNGNPDPETAYLVSEGSENLMLVIPSPNPPPEEGENPHGKGNREELFKTTGTRILVEAGEEILKFYTADPESGLPSKTPLLTINLAECEDKDIDRLDLFSKGNFNPPTEESLKENLEEDIQEGETFKDSVTETLSHPLPETTETEEFDKKPVNWEEWEKNNHTDSKDALWDEEGTPLPDAFLFDWAEDDSEEASPSRIAAFITEELSNPSDQTKAAIARRLGYENSTSPSFHTALTKGIELVTAELVKTTIARFLAEQGVPVIATTAPTLEAEPETEPEPEPEPPKEEEQALSNIQAMLRPFVSPDRIELRENQSYLAILLDDNNRKTLCRLYLQSSKKSLVFLDTGRKEVRHPLENVEALLTFLPHFKEQLSRYGVVIPKDEEPTEGDQTPGETVTTENPEPEETPEA